MASAAAGVVCPEPAAASVAQGVAWVAPGRQHHDPRRGGGKDRAINVLDPDPNETDGGAVLRALAN